ncbi:MAG: type II secretion system ATPase GspE [Candidatus Omnitrophica bacterium]|nr:type II secretion system ATPase GspE [Candidatus Omnitrophota bacterium]
MRQKALLGEILLKEGIIENKQLQLAVSRLKEANQRIGRILIELGFATEEDVLRMLAFQLGIPYLKLSGIEIDRSVIAKIPVKFASLNKLIPLSMDDDLLKIAMADPMDIHTLDDLKLLLACEVKLAVSSEDEIVKAIRKHYGVGADTMEKMVEATADELEQEALKADKVENKEELAEDASVIKFVNQIIAEAYNDRATDIHFEPFEDELRIRYRIDGVLHKITTPQSIRHFQSAIISRVKIMADLNIAEKRLPQDGRVTMNLPEGEIHLRVATIPTIFGENIDIRILPKGKIVFGLRQLGMSDFYLKQMFSLISRPHGIILVTGPTGSGKTTTLYASLSKINSADKKIITVEDPIEYQLKGVNQIQVKPKISLTFAMGLRSILRMDPDIIMVGEIRDSETAEIAIRSALTGHLVFSTLHTNDAAGAVTRLIDMGIEPFLVSSSINAVLAQRLVRVICEDCKESYRPEGIFLDEIGFKTALKKRGLKNSTFYRGRGCEKCMRTGYKGRTGIYELLIVSDRTKRLILQRTPTEAIKEDAVKLGMKTLREYGWDKVIEGVTTIDEVLRVTEAELNYID